MGVAAPFGAIPASNHVSPGADASQEDRLVRTQPAGTSAYAHAAHPSHTLQSGTARPAYDPLTDPHSATATIVDMPVFDAEHRLGGTQPSGAGHVERSETRRGGSHEAGFAGSERGKTQPMAPVAGSKEARSGGTLMGVARPGIAPLRPGVQKTPIDDRDEPPPSYRPLEELGATQHVPRQRNGPAPAANLAKAHLQNTHPLGKRRFDKRAELRKQQMVVGVGRKKPSSSKRAIFVLAAAAVLVIGAVAVVMLWPSQPPLKAQVRATDGGAEVLDVTCASCPDGTTLALRGATETEVKGGRATLSLETPLQVGDNSMRVTIDRPGSGRDEVVTLPVRVAYRIRPDLTMLEADRPSIQIVVEAMSGATIELDGEEVQLRDGRAVKTVDVSKEVTGVSSDTATQLSRRISFVVRPPDAPEEKGVVAVSVPVLPLTIEAPGRSIITEKQTFLLAGRSSPGAEIVVAGRSLGTMKDGAFSQTMNVSSVGATEIEVRAKMPGHAPRLVRVGVERVTSLESSIDSFSKRSPLDYAAVVADLNGSSNKPVALAGEVIDMRTQDGITTMIVRVAPPACRSTSCLVRLVQGRTDLGVDRGAKIRAYGVVAGSIAHEGATIPDVDVAFAIVDRAPDATSPTGVLTPRPSTSSFIAPPPPSHPALPSSP
ncbi:MAG: hypothetical protein HOW73_40880 [Polyangiaceae bacterium]|nr:hypothetical protein [Polyangiaceae bacterium]